MIERRPRRERERERHRQEILEAARKIVAARGVQGVTVEHVAREADFAVGSIYRHFRSKEELIQELFGFLIDSHLEDVNEILVSESPFMAQLDDTVRLLYARQVESRPIYLALHSTPGDLPDATTPAGQLFRSYPARMHAALAGLIEHGQRVGQIRQGDPLPMAVALNGMVSAWSRLDLFGIQLEGDPIAQITEQFLRGAAA
jgi:TetR/AcrR family transcriptional regulator